jgi:group II intron reverse transcriptase/maturase
MPENNQKLICGETEIVTNKISYTELVSLESLQAGLKRVKGNVTPGIDSELKASITEKRLQQLSHDLMSQKYSPKPSKKIGIPKPDGGLRYLGISSNIDKVVQGAILNALEPKAEKLFTNVSYGFRPGLGCHDALKEIKFKWPGVTWLIKVDIRKCFDKIHHEVLLKLLENYCDQATLELIRKLLKVGYVDIHNLNDRAKYKIEGTPEGSIISPILCNIVLHELDQYVTSILIPRYTVGDKRARNLSWNPSIKRDYTSVERNFLEKYPAMENVVRRAIRNQKVKDGVPFVDPNDSKYRRLGYVRYADDFMLGFIGPREEAEDIMKDISAQLENLKLEANKEKSKIYHSSTEGILYLGVYMRYFDKNKIVKDRSNTESVDGEDIQVARLVQRNLVQAQFRVPVEKILNRLIDRGYATRRKDKTIRATSSQRLIGLDDVRIVDRYSSIIRGLFSYYSCVNQRSDLWSICAVLRKSCALTLARRHNLGSASRAYNRFGLNLRVRNEVGKMTMLDYPTSLKTKINFKVGRKTVGISGINSKIDFSSWGNVELKNASCMYPGCTSIVQLEEHHTNPMGNLKRKDLSPAVKGLIRNERRTITLCRKHHDVLHNRGVLVKKTKTSVKKNTSTAKSED